MRDVATKREELEQYRERVFQELRLRGERLKEIDGKLASVEYVIEATLSARTMISGDTARVLSRASYKAKLSKDREALRARRAEALEDLKRAETRLEEVDTELEELEESEGIEAVESDNGRED
jgi:hypothetical protein